MPNSYFSRLAHAGRRLFLVLCLSLGSAHAACPPPRFTAPADIRLQQEAVLLVVHASAAFDARVASKRGVDEAIRFAKHRGLPIIHLHDDGPPADYFAADCAADYSVRSQGGELGFDLNATQVYVVGGHLELCLSTAVNELIYRWAKQPVRSRTLTFLMDGIYSNGKSIDPAAPYYGDFNRFMDIVTWGRPGGEHWPKLTLLETMGIIRSEVHELDYIKDILPRWDTTFPDHYRIEVRMNQSSPKVLRAAPGWQPPTIRFDFIDSAAVLDAPPGYT
ncbi:MAG: hypothetical protein PHT48_13020, partial [Dechloromonas sp.]|nr:hypothetical protein [Dechloromonas sp.]